MRNALDNARRDAIGVLIDVSLDTLSSLGKVHPASRRLFRGVEITRDVPYVDSGDRAHLLDIYRPADAVGPLPVMIYVHGGGFRILSKDTHWMMALKFAQAGYVVFSINYRLAPGHTFPAAVHDTFDAVEWVADHAHAYGGDAEHISLAGESAGANLICTVIAATCYRLDHPRARELHARELPIEAALPACGLLQVTDPERFRRRKPDLPPWLDERIGMVCRGYHEGEHHPLADPLLVFEDRAPVRDLPPTLAICGTRDPILEDTRRLSRAITAAGGHCELSIHPGGVHAFHAVFWSEPAISAWQHQLDFLDRHRLARGRAG